MFHQRIPQVALAEDATGQRSKLLYAHLSTLGIAFSVGFVLFLIRGHGYWIVLSGFAYTSFAPPLVGIGVFSGLVLLIARYPATPQLYGSYRVSLFYTLGYLLMAVSVGMLSSGVLGWLFGMPPLPDFPGPGETLNLGQAVVLMHWAIDRASDSLAAALCSLFNILIMSVLSFRFKAARYSGAVSFSVVLAVVIIVSRWSL